jgi:hypothetical protein
MSLHPETSHVSVPCDETLLKYPEPIFNWSVKSKLELAGFSVIIHRKLYRYPLYIVMTGRSMLAGSLESPVSSNKDPPSRVKREIVGRLAVDRISRHVCGSVVLHRYEPDSPTISPEYVQTFAEYALVQIGSPPNCHLADRIPVVPHGSGLFVGFGVGVSGGVADISGVAGMHKSSRETVISLQPEISHISVVYDERPL